MTALLVLLLLTIPGMGQEKGDKVRLKVGKAGTRLQKVFTGTVVRKTDTSLVIDRENDKPLAIPYRRIIKLEGLTEEKGHHAGKGALYGAGITGGAGAIFFGLWGPEAGMAGALLGSISGAVFGALIGAGSSKDKWVEIPIGPVVSANGVEIRIRL